MAGATTAVTTLRLLAISRGDFEQAVYLASSASPTALLAILLTNAVPLLLILCLVLWWGLGSREGLSMRMWFSAPWILAILYFAFPVIPALVLGLIVVAAVVGLLRNRDKSEIWKASAAERLSEDAEGSGRSGLYLAITSSILLALFSLDSTPWLPAERVTEKGKDPLTAYVLSESDRALVLLGERPRVVFVMPAEGTTRESCQVPSEGLDWPWMSKSLSALLHDAPLPRQVECPASTPG